MKITMPEVQEFDIEEMKVGEMYLVKYGDAVEAIYTAINIGDIIIILITEGGVSTMPLRTFRAYYKIIRPYQPGEQLTITR